MANSTTTAAVMRAEIGAEARANLRLALPIIATQFTFMGMSTADTIMAGRLGAQTLAAVGIGANIWFLCFMLFSSVLMACSPIVAQRNGAGRSALCTGVFVRAALLLAVGLGLLWTAAMWLSTRPVLDWLGLDATTRAGAADYMRIVAWSGVPLCLCTAARNVADGHGLAHVAMLAGLVGLSTNALADYVLMYGRFGFPALGAAGCAWASVIASLVMLCVYALRYGRLAPLRAMQVQRLRGGWALREHLPALLRLGVPIALIMAAEAWMFNIGALLLARFGPEVIAAHQIAINVAAMAFMVPLGVGFATTVRVGFAVGGGDAGAARMRGQTGMLIGVAFAVFSAAIMALLPGRIVALYTGPGAVAELAVRFLYFAAVFQIFDCIQATASGALRGYKDTRLPMLITIAAYWGAGMPLAVWLIGHSDWGPMSIWWGFIVALAVAAGGLATRFARKARSPALMAAGPAPMS